MFVWLDLLCTCSRWHGPHGPSEKRRCRVGRTLNRNRLAGIEHPRALTKIKILEQERQPIDEQGQNAWDGSVCWSCRKRAGGPVAGVQLNRSHRITGPTTIFNRILMSRVLSAPFPRGPRLLMLSDRLLLLFLLLMAQDGSERPA